MIEEKMSMKKLFALCLVTVLLLCFAACGGASGTKTDSSAPASANNSSASQPTADAEPTPEPTSEPAPEPAFTEQTVLDNDKCAITVTGVESKSSSFVLKTHLENKSADQTFMFSVTDAYLNNVQFAPLFAQEVAAGKNANQDMTFFLNTLDDGISLGSINDVQLALRVYDSNDWTADAVAEEIVHVYPLGEENVAPFERESQPSDIVLANEDSLAVTVVGFDPDALGGYAVKAYLQNKSDVEIMFSIDEASINGTMANPVWAKSLAPGTSGFADITWYDTVLEESGIDSVETIEFLLKARDANDWTGDSLLEQTVTLTP